MGSFILSAVRTPIGCLNGALSTISAPELGAVCIRAALERAKCAPESVDEVIMGNVVAAGLGQNPARQAAVRAGIPYSVGAMTVNKVCGSGLKAVMLADQAIRAGDAEVVVAGGMESMTRAPYLALNARQGFRLGHAQLLDAVIHDGLCDAYQGESMGVYGDTCARHCGFSREMQDDFAVRSYRRALEAIATRQFAPEIQPVKVMQKKQVTLVDADEEPQRFNESKLRELSPAFGKEGTVTAGNASSVNDGAAALVVGSEAAARERKVEPLARIVGGATFSREPEWFTLAPIDAIRRLLARVEWKVEDVDLFEINEAFAAVAMAAIEQLDLDPEKVNVFGGAVALGHPIGASGARILVTLLNALAIRQARRGVACLCVGGGEAVALAVESR